MMPKSPKDYGRPRGRNAGAAQAKEKECSIDRKKRTAPRNGARNERGPAEESRGRGCRPATESRGAIRMASEA